MGVLFFWIFCDLCHELTRLLKNSFRCIEHNVPSAILAILICSFQAAVNLLYGSASQKVWTQGEEGSKYNNYINYVTLNCECD